MCEFKQVDQTLSFIMILMTHWPHEIRKSIKSNTFTINNKVINNMGGNWCVQMFGYKEQLG